MEFLFGFILGGLNVAIFLLLVWMFFAIEYRMRYGGHKYIVNDEMYHVYSKTKETKNDDKSS